MGDEERVGYNNLWDNSQMGVWEKKNMLTWMQGS
jgi:hypothetical protein